MIAQPPWKNSPWLIVTIVAYLQVDYQQKKATETERNATLAINL